MGLKTKEVMIQELVGKEINFKRMDGSLATAHERYELSNSILASMILNSHLIAFAFYEAEEAVELVAKLVNDYSSFELNEIAVSSLGGDVVEYYKDMFFQDYAITQGPLSKALIDAAQGAEEGLEELDRLLEEVEGKIKKDIK